MHLLEREARRKLPVQYDDCPTECVNSAKQWDWRRSTFCEDCPHKSVRDGHRELLEQMMHIRMGDDARHYRPEELRGMVYEIAGMEDADRASMGAKDARLLGLYLAEKTKLDRQKDPPKTN